MGPIPANSVLSKCILVGQKAHGMQGREILTNAPVFETELLSIDGVKKDEL